MPITPTLNRKTKEKVDSKVKRVTRLSECSMSQSSKKIKDLNEKVMKYIANQ